MSLDFITLRMYNLLNVPNIFRNWLCDVIATGHPHQDNIHTSTKNNDGIIQSQIHEPFHSLQKETTSV